jgi:hypothetical protein
MSTGFTNPVTGYEFFNGSLAAAMERADHMVEHRDVASDQEKLHAAADFLDIQDVKRGVFDATQIQEDLRGVADRITRLEEALASAVAAANMHADIVSDWSGTRPTVYTVEDFLS